MNNSGFNRRNFLGFAGLGAGALALAACGGPSTGTPGTASAAADLDYSGVKPAKEITFWSNHPGKSQDVEKQLIEKFHAAQSGIRVNLVTAGKNYEEVAQKFQTAQTGGDLPNIVIFSDVWWFRYFLNGSIIPLGPLMDQLGFAKDDYRDQLLTDYQYDGKQWAIPYARSTPLFYYNKDHFKAAGLPDRAPATWAEMAEWAPKIKSANSGIQNVYQNPDLAGYAGWTLQNLLWGNGGAWSDKWNVTADMDQNVKSMQWLQDTIYKDKWAGVSSKSSSDDLVSGAVSATLESTGSLVGVLKSAKFNVGVGFLPGGSVSRTGVCPTGGAGLGIPKNTTKEQQLAAATFLKFMTEPENTAAFSAATGYMPVRKSSNMDTVLAKTPMIKTALDQLDVTRTQDFARAFLPGADQEMAKTCAAIMTQKADVKTSLSDLKKVLEGIYTNDVKPKLA